MSNSSTTLSVVVPLYCEEEQVRKLYLSLETYIQRQVDSWELILVDDGSTDNTWGEIETLSHASSNLRAIRLSRNFGKESALCAGLEAARGDAILVLDGDLQHPPSLIPDMIRIWKEKGVNIVEAVKEDRGKESFVNKCCSSLFYGLFSRFSGFDLRGASDFKLIDRQVRDAWLKMGERNLFFRGMIAWLGFRREPIPFAVEERADGKSRWSTLGLIRLALTGFTSFSGAFLRLPSVLGVFFFIFAVILGIDALYMKFSGKAVSGFTTVILLLLIIGSLLLICLGIIGEYLARIYEEVKRRPRYIIREKLDKDE